MTSRNIINSDFYQIVNVDTNDNPTSVKPQYLPIVGLTQGSNITLSNTAGNWTVTANAQYSNTLVANYLPTYSGNLQSLQGNVTTTANISASYYLGNGSQLTGIQGNYSNANVQAYLPTYTGAIGGNITMGNVFTNQLYFANGQPYSFPTTYGNSNVANYLPTFTGNVQANYVIANTVANTSVNLLREPVQVNASPQLTLVANLTNQSIFYYTTFLTGTKTVNFTTQGTLATQVQPGNTVSAVIVLTNGASNGVITGTQIDSVNITPRWLGGAPQSNTTGVDVYTFNLIRLGTGANWSIIASKGTAA